MDKPIVKKKGLKVSHLINIILAILLIATVIFAYFYINSRTISAIDDIEESLSPENKPPIFIANIYGSDSKPLKGPLAVANDKDGKIVVVDSGNSIIQIFNQNGKFLNKFGKFGTNPGEFNYPTSIAINSEGLLYIGDFNNNRVQVFSQKGMLINTINKKKIGDAVSPLALAIDKNDNLYIANRNGKVYVLDFNGNLKLKFGQAGSKDGYLSYPNGIAIGKNNEIYISDSGNFRVQVFSQDGKLLRSADQQTLKVAIPKGIAVDERERIYVVDNFQHRVNVFDKDWKLLFNIGHRGLNEGQLNYPNGVFIDNNKVFITDRENNRVSIFKY